MNRDVKIRNEVRIVFLHHSTGQYIWNGNRSTPASRIVSKISARLSYRLLKRPVLPELFRKYNHENNVNYIIKELTFPRKTPYGWNNYPYDYYNIWVKNAGNKSFMGEPTLEMLTKDYQVIIFKHCFPVSNIQEDRDRGDVDSDLKTLANYKLQYLALRSKLSEFKNVKFILFTGAARIKSQVSEEEAKRAKEFHNWVIDEWNSLTENIYLWDFYDLQTDGELYFKETKAYSEDNSHPNETFAGFAARLLFNRIIDIINTGGMGTTLTGETR